MWIGGLPPIGYDIQGKRPIINDVEAETVRKIFSLYLDLKNVRLVKQECDRLSIRTKPREYEGKRN
jgi:hypothetical protein